MGVYSGNRTLLGESTYNADEPTHIMEMVLECERNDLRMFEAVINCDFIEAYNEAGIISLSEEGESDAKEETKKGIAQKIKELFKKAIEAVKRFVSSFIAKIKNMFANDAKLYKQYAENFKKNAKGYKIYGWREIKGDPEAIANDSFDAACKAFTSTMKEIDNCSDNDSIAKYLEKHKKKIKEENIAKMVDELFFGDKKDDAYPLDGSDVDLIDKTVRNSTRAINSVKNFGKAAIRELENERKGIKADAILTDEKDELGLAKANAKYKAAGMSIKEASKVLNAVCNAYARYLAQCRKAFVMAGKNATAKEDQKKDQAVNASYDFILGEASDDYVERMLLTD